MSKLREIRTEKGITIDDIAEKLGVTRQAVWYWDAGKGKPTLIHALKLAAYLDCTVSELAGED